MRLVLSWLLVASCVAGCAQDVGPESPYFDACTSDATCGDFYRCLPWSGFGVPRTVCTTTCRVATDCPLVRTQHCGDLTACEAGICGYRPCR